MAFFVRGGSRPVRGARIEITASVPDPAPKAPSRPVRGARIEITLRSSRRGWETVAPRKGRED